MKALLDEQLDSRLRTALAEFEVFTLLDFGWLGLKNGELREMVNLHGFDLLISADKNMPFQQNLSKIKFTLVLLDLPSMLFQTQLLFVPKLKNCCPIRPNLCQKLSTSAWMACLTK